MKREFIFPILLIILDLAAAVVYSTSNPPNYWKSVYWIGAAVLTFVVTFGKV